MNANMASAGRNRIAGKSGLSQVAIAIGLAAAIITVDVWAEDAKLISRLDETVSYLAADELEGRGVGTAGSLQAMQYLKDQFSAAGAAVETQSLTITMNAEIGPLPENRLVLAGPPRQDGSRTHSELTVLTDFNPLAIGGSAAVSAPLVFAGYGITTDTFDEYAQLDVTGKVVVILRKEPQQADEASVFAGKRASRHAFFTTKIANADKHGAAGVIIVNDRFGIDATAREVNEELDDLLDRLLTLRDEYRSVEDRSEQDQAAYRQESAKLIDQLSQLRKRLDGSFDELLSVEGAGSASEHPQLPVFFARREPIEAAILQATGKELQTIELEIDQTLVPQSHDMPGWSVDAASNIVRNSAEVHNVVATFPGRGSLANEVVIVGAHYDHLGMGGVGSLAPWTKEVHNGADDNASGTAVLLEIARHLGGIAEEPSRTLVLIAFAGEERGLLGSAHYVSNPLHPLENTVAMVNMDMIGRLRENRLTIYGTGTALGFDSLIDELNQEYKFEIVKVPQGSGPSDHASFYRKEIPVFHFFTGTHRDYHRPSDDVEKINFAGMARVNAMVTALVERLARQQERPQYQRVSRRRGR